MDIYVSYAKGQRTPGILSVASAYFTIQLLSKLFQVIFMTFVKPCGPGVGRTFDM